MAQCSFMSCTNKALWTRKEGWMVAPGSPPGDVCEEHHCWEEIVEPEVRVPVDLEVWVEWDDGVNTDCQTIKGYLTQGLDAVMINLYDTLVIPVQKEGFVKSVRFRPTNWHSKLSHGTPINKFVNKNDVIKVEK